MPTPSGSTTREIGISSGGRYLLLTGGCLMATTLEQTHPLLLVPFSAATEFTVMADYCENFAETLAECNDPALRMALYGRLSACLMLLKPALLEPIPQHLVESFTVDAPPSESPVFEADSTDICQYSLALTQVLMGQGLSPKIRNALSALLFDLIHLFSAEIKAPRWIRTVDGIKPIDESISRNCGAGACQ